MNSILDDIESLKTLRNPENGIRGPENLDNSENGKITEDPKTENYCVQKMSNQYHPLK